MSWKTSCNEYRRRVYVFRTVPYWLYRAYHRPCFGGAFVARPTEMDWGRCGRFYRPWNSLSSCNDAPPRSLKLTVKTPPTGPSFASGGDWHRRSCGRSIRKPPKRNPPLYTCFDRAVISAPSFRPRGRLRVFPPARNFLRGSRARTARCHSQSWGPPLSRAW